MKYKQRGYQEDDQRDERRRPERPRRDPDLPGGRLADPHRVIRMLRCHRCGQALPLDLDARGEPLPIPPAAACSSCSTAIHACRNCIHFDPDSHNECRKPVKTSYRKDAANECELYEPKVVVEMTRDQGRSESPTGSIDAAPESPSDARKAFEDLFK